MSSDRSLVVADRVEHASWLRARGSRGTRARSAGCPRPGRRRACPVVPAQIETTCSSIGNGGYCGCLSSSTRRAPRASCGLATPRRGRRRTPRTPRARGTAPGRARSVPATLLHRLDLRRAADAGHRDADVDRRALTPALNRSDSQEDLAVGDRDDVGRDVRRDVVGLGLDDRQTGHRAGAELVGELRAALEQTACAGRRRHRGRPRGPAGGAAAATRRGRPRPAWTGRRR